MLVSNNLTVHVVSWSKKLHFLFVADIFRLPSNLGPPFLFGCKSQGPRLKDDSNFGEKKPICERDTKEGIGSFFIFRRFKLKFLWLKWSTIGHWNQRLGVQIPSVAELCSAFTFANPTAASKIESRIWVPASLSFSDCQHIKMIEDFFLGTLLLPNTIVAHKLTFSWQSANGV